MKGLTICILATAWVLGVIYAMSRRSCLEASPCHARYTRYIRSADGEAKLVESNDRDFRHFVCPAHNGQGMCPVHGWQCWKGTLDAKDVRWQNGEFTRH